MLVAANFQQHATRLVDPSISDEERRKLALEVREAIEVVHSQDYGPFLQHFLPAFVQVLTVITRPQWDNNDTHKTRSIILEVMSRLPHNEVLKNRFHQLLPLAMNVMQTDNEENSVTAIHIVFDLHKTFRPQLETQVEPFLSFVRQLYSSLSSTVDAVLLADAPPQEKILPASRSFKVITECPLVVMFVFQLYPRCIRANIQALLPLMLKAIQIQIPNSKPQVFRKPAYKDFIAAQVKTVTFLVYLLKQVSNLMNFDEAWIPQSVVQLLKACPGNAIAIRKELLVATRHMLSSPFRKGFFSGIDALLDEKVIAGTGRASTDALRPLGYQFLAELIHGVRFELQLPQLHRIITMFSTNLHDPSFTFALQSNAVRLLLNLVEGILRRNDAKSPKPRSLLVRIMKTMVMKYETIGEQVPELISAAEESLGKYKALSKAETISTQVMGDPLKEVKDCKQLLRTLTLGLKTVVWSVINVKVALKTPPQVPGLPDKAKPRADTQGTARPSIRGDSEKAMVLLEEETEVLTRLLPASRKCFKVFTVSELRQSTNSHDHPGTQSSEKEIFDQFAQIFTILDVRSFQNIFGLRMDVLLDYIVENQNSLVIAQHFLSNQNIAKYFADILLGYVVEKLSSLGVVRPKPPKKLTLAQKQCNALLSLFKSLFYTISTSLEQVLRLHITPIVRKCINLALECEDPHFYLQLLRCLFKSLTGGKKHDVQFDALFRDFMPLVEPVLSGLTALCHGPHRLVHKDVIVELCLLVPARPATLFPFLHIQIKPILWALSGSKENVQYGLRALDFWLEILQPSYIETLLQGYETEISNALHFHLRSPEAAVSNSRNGFGTAALRILGKLGARSRRLALNPAPFQIQKHPEAVVQYLLKWVGVRNPSFILTVDRIIERAYKVVLDDSPNVTITQKGTAWEFVHTCLMPYFGLQQQDNFLFPAKELDKKDRNLIPTWTKCKNVERFKLQVPASVAQTIEGCDTRRSRGYCEAERDKVRSMLVTLLITSSMPDFSSLANKTTSPSKFAFDLCRYFAVMLMSRSSQTENLSRNGNGKLEKSKDKSSIEMIDPGMFLDALLEAICLERENHRDAGLNCLKHFLSHLLQLQKDDTDVYSLPTAISHIILKLCKFCYHRKWNLRIASVCGLRHVLGQLPAKCFRIGGIKSLAPAIVKALFAVSEEPSNFRRLLPPAWAKLALIQLINSCHGQSRRTEGDIDQELIEDVVKCITSKLASRSVGTREMAKEALARLSLHLKKPVPQLIQNQKYQIFAPLRKRSIRQFQVCDQIGYLDAVSYCIGLREKSFASKLFSDPLKTTVLLGALSILDDPTVEKLTESDETARSKVVETKNPQTGLVVKLTKLRFQAVELLSAVALHCSDFVGNQGNDELSRRMITVFFKCLQSRDQKIVRVAKVGLKEAISTNKNPKETLQNNLRPILSNLADYKKLTLPYLDGLSRILELLSHWFNVNLGDKLLEHLSHWTEPQKMAMHTRRHPGTEAKIAASILDLFHLLPAAANKFMDSMVYMVLRLEFEQGVAGPGVGRLGLKGRNMASISPFREPLLKFCNKHADCAVNFFLSRLDEERVRHLFFVLLRAQNAIQLRAKLRAEVDSLVTSTFKKSKSPQEVMANAYHGIVLIDAILLDASSTWLVENSKIFSAVFDHWNHRAKEHAQGQKIVRAEYPNEIDEYLVTARVLMRFCKESLPANSVLFSMLWVFGLRMECDFSFMKRFLHNVVTRSINATMKNSILCHFLDCFAKNEYSQEWKVNALQMIVIPMLKEHLRSVSGIDSSPSNSSPSHVATSTDCSLPQDFSDNVLNSNSLSRVVKELFDRPDEVLRTYDETLSAELLQLSTLLIQYLPAQVGTYRKELIKFGWAHLKREESVAKHWAFVNVSRFFQAYQAPPKIILQVYVALLRAVQSESKGLVKLALDVLTPALPRRLEHNPNDLKCPIWIRYTKKVLLEEGHSVVNLVHIWQLIIRHADLFYVARAQFVPIMVTSLPRIGNQSNNSAEYRRVALDLAKLIICWRKKTDDLACGNPPPAKKPRLEEPAENNATNSKSISDEFQPNPQMISATIGFLSQLPFRMMDRRERNLVSQRSVALVDHAVDSATSVDFSAIILDKLLDMSEKSHEQAARLKTGPAATSGSNAAHSHDARSNGNQKAAQARAEKNEAIRNDYANHRAAALKAGLELCIVLTKKHCASFTETKANVLVSLVNPVFTGKDAPAAKLLGQLVSNFISSFPNWGQEQSQSDTGGQAKIGKMEPVTVSFITAILSGVEESLKSDSVDMNYNGLVVLKDILAKKPHIFLRYRDLLIRLFQRLVKDHVQAPPNGSTAGKTEQSTEAGMCIGDGAVLGKNAAGMTGSSQSGPKASPVAVKALCKTHCLSLLGENIVSLEAVHRKAFIQGLCILIERSETVEVLLEIVRVVSDWVTWRHRVQTGEKVGSRSKAVSSKEPLALKEKVQLLLKMIVFDRITGYGSVKLMNAYLEVILTIFGSKGCTDRRPELLPKLERAFLVGLNCRDSEMRGRFFRLFDASLTRNPISRLHYIMSRQDWTHLVETYWIKHAIGLLIHTVDLNAALLLPENASRFPRLLHLECSDTSNGSSNVLGQCKDDSSFLASLREVRCDKFVNVLQELVIADDELAYLTWIEFFPQVWHLCSIAERKSLESSFSNLLMKEYHVFQCSWQRNVIQALLEGAFKSKPRLKVSPELMLHLGSRWNAWFLVIDWLCNDFETIIAKAKPNDNEVIALEHVLGRIFDVLYERDHFAGLVKQSCSPRVREAVSLEQMAREDEAQALYSQVMQQYQATLVVPSAIPTSNRGMVHREVVFCESRWVYCAKELCQWEVLMEFARSVVQSDLLHECLWRAPDWSAMKELLYRHPVEDGPTLRLYQAYIHLQENKLDSAESSITNGFKKSAEKFCALPNASGHVCVPEVLNQFQQLVELEESSRILLELNALSRHGSINVNVEQKIEAVKNILCGWRERLPSQHESLSTWNAVLSWRNHVHAIVVNVLETLKDTANAKVLAAQSQNDQSQVNGRNIASGNTVPTPTSADVQAAYAIAQSLPQHVLVIGVNETAWNIHRFARACRKQGHPNVAIHALLKLYPFGTMELSEYFVKTMESAKSFLLGPRGLQNNINYGLNELNRCNMDHFNPRQKAQLFAMKGKFYRKLGLAENSVDAFSIALSLSNEVASGWLGWATHCDEMHGRTRNRTEKSRWRVSAVNLYVQSIRCGSRKARRLVARLLRLISYDESEQRGLSPVSSPNGQNAPHGALRSALSSLLETIPVWVWIPWIPQLMAMLQRSSDTSFTRAVLLRVCRSFPQSTFYPFRSFFAERLRLDEPAVSVLRDTEKKISELPAIRSPVDENSTKQLQAASESLKQLQHRHQIGLNRIKQFEGDQTNGVTYAKLTEEVRQLTTRISKVSEGIRAMQQRQKHYNSLGKEETPNKSTVNGPNTTANENSGNLDSAKNAAFGNVDWLLAHFARSNRVLYFELNRFALELDTKMRSSRLENVTSVIRSLLAFVLDRTDSVSQTKPLMSFSPLSLESVVSSFSSFYKDESADALVSAFVLEFKKHFTAGTPGEAQELVQFLRKWRNIFELKLRDTCSKLDLESLSPYLVSLVESDIEVFGQYNLSEASEIRADNMIKVSAFEAALSVAQSHHGFARTVEMLGNNGRKYFFTIESGLDPSSMRRENLTAQFFGLVNASVFARFAHSTRRRISIAVPKFVPLGLGSRISTMDFTNSTLAWAIEMILERHDSPYDDMVMKFRERLTSLPRTSAFREILAQNPENLLLRFLTGKIPKSSELFLFRKKFAESVGANALVNSILFISNRRPENLAISWNAGTLTDLNARPEFNGRGIVANSEPTLSRLTPNIQHVLGRIGKDGSLLATVLVVFQAFQKHRDLLKIYLDLILHDLLEPMILRWPIEQESRHRSFKTSTMSCLRSNRATAILEAMCKSADSPLESRKLLTHVESLLSSSMKLDFLPSMPASYQAWF